MSERFSTILKMKFADLLLLLLHLKTPGIPPLGMLAWFRIAYSKPKVVIEAIVAPVRERSLNLERKVFQSQTMEGQLLRHLLLLRHFRALKIQLLQLLLPLRLQQDQPVTGIVTLMLNKLANREQIRIHDLLLLEVRSTVIHAVRTKTMKKLNHSLEHVQWPLCQLRIVNPPWNHQDPLEAQQTMSSR